MPYLTKKKINGKIYYYAEECGRVNGKVQRLWQKYLGSIEKILSVAEHSPRNPLYAEIFRLGNPAAYFHIAREFNMIDVIDKVLPKREQGMTIGQYLLLAAINRGIDAVSKRSMWHWFQSTVLLRLFPHATQTALSSQRFWDHMSMVPHEEIEPLWSSIVDSVIKKEKIDLSTAAYDGTNFYTFIGSFNGKCSLAQRGKNKQGRKDLRQINYALFCTRRDQFPLYFDIYEGNRHDSKEFKEIVDKFMQRFSGHAIDGGGMTIVFDKGNNSYENFSFFIQNSPYHFVGSVKLDDHKDLSEMPNTDSRLERLADPRLESVRAWRTQKKIYGRELTVVVTFNNRLYTDQVQSINNQINKCFCKLDELESRLNDRRSGLITRGAAPTLMSVKNQVSTILSGQHMKKLVATIVEEVDGFVLLQHSINTQAYAALQQTYLGKSILITDNDMWSTEDIVLTYRSLYVIEHTFKHMKDREIGLWWPLLHWTDQKIRVHGLYCTIALALRSLLMKRVKDAGIRISMNALHEKLNGIKEVINVFPRQRGKKKEVRQSVVTKMDEIQKRLYDLFRIGLYCSQLGSTNTSS
jgi:transposase